MNDTSKTSAAIRGAFGAFGLIVLMLAGTGCKSDQPEAYGNFEAIETTVSAELAGRLLRFDPVEGDLVRAGTSVAQIDSVPLSLQRQELWVQRETALVRTEEAQAQVAVLQAELATAKDDRDRARRLFAGEAATAHDLNRLEGAVLSLEAQIAAARARVRLVSQEGELVSARLSQLADQFTRSRVVSPVSGTVLTTFVEPGEYVQPGRALFTAAALDTLDLRAYVSGGQLADLTIGAEVRVAFDAGNGTLETRSGRIIWIASEAEFTPTPIQTRDERVDQVYALKVRVPNSDGRLKIGMPGELVAIRGDSDRKARP